MRNSEMTTYRQRVAFRTSPGGPVKVRAFSANNRADAEHSLFVWSQRNAIEIHEILSR